MAARREIDLAQPRSVWKVLGAAVALYERYPVLFALLAVAVIAPYELFVLVLAGYGPLRHSHEAAETSILLWLARASLITPLISALHMHAVVAIGERRRPRLGDVAARGLRVLPVVAAAEIMASLGIALGFVALVIPGIVLTLRWAVVAQAAAIGDGTWLDALRDSRALTRRNYVRIFVLLAAIWALTFGAYRGAWAIPLGNTSHAPSVAVGIAIDSAIASFAALTFAVLFFDLRARAASPARPMREHPQLRDLD